MIRDALKEKQKKEMGTNGNGKRIVVYPGSFDPFTNGHINIVERGLFIYDAIIVAVANNTSKRTIFTPLERVNMIREIFKGRDNIIVDTFDGLLVDYCRKNNHKVILRGLRTVSDFEFEFQIAHANRQLNRDVETIFMMTESGLSHLSSTIIKEIISLGGKTRGMIPPIVERELMKKYGFKGSSPRSSKRRK